MLELEARLISEYGIECRNILGSLVGGLLAMEGSGAASDPAAVDRMLRGTRSIRLASELLGFDTIGEVAGGVEQVLAEVLARRMELTPTSTGMLLRAFDCLGELLGDCEDSNTADVSRLLEELAALTAGSSEGPGSGSADAPRERKAGLRVLLVEDDFVCRMLLQVFLNRYGECHIAVNGREAVEAFRTAAEQGRPYDLVCMDIMMPEMDGREAVRQIRSLEAAQGILSTDGVKIFMTTALTGIREMSECFVELCDAYLTKPIDIGKLLAHMRSYALAG
jgi:two-component system chemotaxis response regulator CheY